MSGEKPFEGEPLRLSAEARRAQGSLAAQGLRDAVGRLVLETTGEGIWLIDADARTTFVNRQLAELLGYAEEEMIGRHVFAFIDRERWPMAERNLKQRQLGIEDRSELQLRRKDGTAVWVLGSANPVFDQDGRYAGSLAVLGELTTQKERERRLVEENDVLRRRLAERRTREAEAQAARPESSSSFREPFRTAVVLAICGTFVTTVALATTGALIGSLFGTDGPPADV